MRAKFMVLATAMAAAFAVPAVAQDISGHWKRGDGIAKVRIAPCGTSLCAVNTWIKDSSGGEKVGDKLIFDVQATGNGTFKGKAFDPQRDLNYSMNIDVADDKNTMKTRGCVLLGMVCKSMHWTRLE